ncbi:MAG: 50S ribosome-binding GTPase [Firmicutes bacterium]|nr:50S ribosome-binding GTPase [Bacillota bacterium]
MQQGVVIGKTNVGKTLFTINFASYCGVQEMHISFREPDGRRSSRVLQREDAAAELAGPEPHKTRRLQSISLELPVGKGTRHLELVDTSGLTDYVHRDVEVRRAIAQSLAMIRDAALILHMVDAALVGESGPVAGLGEVDYQVAQFAQMRRGYAILANKMDLPAAARGLELVRSEFAGHVILPVSALHWLGFREVKQFVAHAL